MAWLCVGTVLAQPLPPSCPTPAFPQFSACDKGGKVVCTAAFGLWGPDLAQAPIACLPVNQVIGVLAPFTSVNGQWLHAQESFTELYGRWGDPRVQFWVVMVNTSPMPVEMDLPLLRGLSQVYPYPYRIDWRQMRAQTPGAIVAMCQGDFYTPGGQYQSPTDSNTSTQSYQYTHVRLQPREVRVVPVSYDRSQDKSLDPSKDHSGSYWLALFRETALTHYRPDPRDVVTAGADILVLDPPMPQPTKRFPG